MLLLFHVHIYRVYYHSIVDLVKCVQLTACNRSWCIADKVTEDIVEALMKEFMTDTPETDIRVIMRDDDVHIMCSLLLTTMTQAGKLQNLSMEVFMQMAYR